MCVCVCVCVCMIFNYNKHITFPCNDLFKVGACCLVSLAGYPRRCAPRRTTVREQSLPEVWYSARRADACSNQHDDVLDSIHSNLLNHVMYGAACLARTQCSSVEPSSSSCSSLFGKTIATMTIVNIVDCVPRVHHVRRK